MADWMTEEQKRALQEQYPKTLSGTGTNSTNNNDNIDWSAIGIPGQEQQTTPTAPTNTTPTSTTPASTTPNKGGTSVSDYIDYYTSRGITNPDKGYEQWVAWMQSGGDSTPSTTPAWTQPSTTPSTTPTSTQGTSVSDYIDYYTSRGITSPDKSYEQWAAWIASGGDTTPSTTPQTTPTTTPTETTPSSTTPTNTTQTETPYDAELAAWAAQTGADYNLLYYIKYGVYPNGSTTPGGNGTGVTGGNYQFTDLPSLPNYEQAIRDMYDAQINAERAALQEQGDQALSDAQANRDKIADTYNRQKNAAAVDWERQRRNFLEGASTSGLNTGAGSQAELSMMGMYQRSQNNLQGQQAQAEAEADRNIADIKRNTQAAINEAVLKNDYQKAAALLDEYKDAYNREMDRAEALASFGDFSGYANIYGEDAAKNMRSTWIMSNPEIALAMGLISQSQYAQLVLYKQYPALALTGGTGYSGGGGDYSGGSDSTAKDKLNAYIDALAQDMKEHPENYSGVI